MSFVHVAKSTKSGNRSNAAERTSFVGARVPEEIKRLPKNLKQFERKTFRRILQVVMNSLEGSEVDPAIYSSICSGDYGEEKVAIIFSGLYKIVQCAIRQPRGSLKKEIFCEDLVQIGIPQDFIPDLSNSVFGPSQEALYERALNHSPHLPKLEDLKWRVDVAISTSTLSRVLEPNIAMQMTTSNGKTHKFEASVKELQHLRYSVAEVLKEMQALESHSILKVS